MEYGIKIINAIASGLLMFAISLGALASHLLKTKLSQDSLSSFEVGVRYLIYHGLALLIVNGLNTIDLDEKLTFSKLALSGIFLFSGSIFMLSTQEIHGWPVKFLGPITPIGGILLISAWGYLTLAFLKK